MYKELYKKSIDIIEQQKTRQRVLLEAQKLHRENLQDANRQLPEILHRVPANNDLNNKKQRNKYKARNFKEIFNCELSLQLSEWLRVRPDDLCDWLLLPCPRGQRCMVVACHGRTEVYNKAGRRYMTFYTQLPGDGNEQKAMTLLDCVYAPKEDAFYVLDALSFGKQDLIDCDAQFRFFWLRSKFEEHEILSMRNDKNEKPFYLLETYDFENSTSIAMALQRYPHWPEDKPELDGFLFYHKEASYSCGTTPLVCWLFPFMVRDVLGLNVSESYAAPADYVTPQQYMHDFDARLAKKKQQLHARNGRRSGEAMEVAEIVVTEPMQAEEADNDDYDNLKKLLDAERCLELGETYVEELLLH